MWRQRQERWWKRNYVVYQIPCLNCVHWRDGKNLKRILTEHKAAVRKGDRKNRVAVHARDDDHRVNWENGTRSYLDPCTGPRQTQISAMATPSEQSTLSIQLYYYIYSNFITSSFVFKLLLCVNFPHSWQRSSDQNVLYMIFQFSAML